MLGIYKDLPEHLHIEPSKKCNAACPQCPRTIGASLHHFPNLPQTEISAEELKKILSNNFFKKLRKVLINGNYGDIVMHTSPQEFIQTFIDLEFQEIQINTNAGGLPTKFWSWLGSQPNVIVEFAIDGLQDTHHLYRRNTRFDTVIKNAKAYIDAGGYARWIMNVFGNNKHQVAECEQMSKDLGFAEFYFDDSVRFYKEYESLVDKNFNEVERLYPTEFVKKNKILEKEDRNKEWYNKIYNYVNQEFDVLQPDRSQSHVNGPENVTCKVTQGLESVYISADYRLWPCCWMEIDYNKKILDNGYSSFVDLFFRTLKKHKDFNLLSKYNVTDIVNAGLLTNIENSWSTKCLDICKRTCASKEIRENHTR